jgi:1-acyl-sn-glycerol-3-phosphate acyltransferase
MEHSRSASPPTTALERARSALVGKKTLRLVKWGLGAIVLYRLLQLAGHSLLRTLARWKVTGVENMPPRGRLIVASNHLHFLDPFALGIALPRQIVFMGKAEVFRTPVVGWIAKGVKGIPVRRGEIDRRALRRAVSVLEAEQVLGMMPEGTRSRTGQLLQGRDGVALVALRTGASILPVGLAGTQQIFPALRRLERAELSVTIGEPISVVRAEGRVPRERVTELTDQVMRRIAGLLPPEYRGVYRDAAGRPPQISSR